MIKQAKTIALFIILIFFSCSSKEVDATSTKESKLDKLRLKVGAENPDVYINKLQDKNVAVVTNHSGIIRIFDDKDSIREQVHLVDFLINKGIKLKAIFAPEHGFRGEKGAGTHIKNQRDRATGLPIYSLHGEHKKPQAEQLKGVDVVLFDIQDVGVRFYTYLSTLHNVMEACAENSIPVIVLDRPNPNGHYVDGPVMEEKYQSFLGMHPVPIVYGMTIGEYALMIEGEKWLSKNLSCDVTVVPLQEWTHKTKYNLPIKPSPNLPNSQAINLYPSLCLFEQTEVSVGRGTETPFQIYGSPLLDSTKYKFSFIPKAMKEAKNPKFKNQKCYGENLKHYPRRLNRIELQWIIKAYKNSSTKENFFWNNFEALSGTDKLKNQIKNGWKEEQIRESWRKDLTIFKNIRKKYLIYPDFKE